MKKIPTIFERDWSGDKSRVLDKVNPAAAWVFAGEGIPTRKIDGTSCLVRKNKLFKRRELREGDVAPPDFEVADKDEETGKTVGWVPVGDGPEDRWHREAWTGCDNWPDGTYELIGPKIQGNPENKQHHLLIKHGGGPAGELESFARTFDNIKALLSAYDMEGIVWHHPDGRMAKIKARDFGLKRAKTPM